VLNHHRGKGQQKVTVEHVHVHSGGQAIVGPVERRSPATPSKSENQNDARQIAHAPQPDNFFGRLVGVLTQPRRLDLSRVDDLSPSASVARSVTLISNG
jgi:hypothetical protein